jgi:rfaE bifunctional protein nucleotidyltransferase chain/domain/rfaE bifunctional protein kinase chain/domain
VTAETSAAAYAAVIERWAGRTVVVVGDMMLDEWRYAETDRLCREAPAPVLRLRRCADAPGGAGNAAVNLAALGARAVLVAPVGVDPAGDRLRACLASYPGVRDRTVPVAGHRTPVKRRLLAADQILLREDEGDRAAALPPTAVRGLRERLREAARSAGRSGVPALVVCDYGLGGLPAPLRRWLMDHRWRFGAVALDAHDLRPWRGLAPTIVTPSFEEAARALGRPAQPRGRPGRPVGEARVVAARDHAGRLRDLTGAGLVAVTLDRDGAVVAGRGGQVRRTHADPAPASHTVGAGDAYLAAATLAWVGGADLPGIAELAQRAAQASVAGTGTCVCDRSALRASLTGSPAGRWSSVVDQAGLGEVVRDCRDRGGRVVFTNGCFDVLHRGHVAYLEQARRLGDLLVVAVNSDDSVRRLKGPGRPVNPVEDRVAVLAALSCVDVVVVFGEDSPTGLIEQARPDVYVKGGDYPPELVPEAPLVRRLGGEVRTLDYVPDRSTSAVIARIRARAELRPAPSGAEGRGS